jgi:hypothetical protein
VDHLPPKLAAKLIAAGIHPDDAKELIGSYQAAKKRPMGNPADFASKVAAIYQTDPDKVEPPKTWRTKEGKVPFEALTPREQATAYRKHQMQVVAMSLAAQHQLEDKLSFDGSVPKDIAARVTQALLKGVAKETEEEPKEKEPAAPEQDEKDKAKPAPTSGPVSGPEEGEKGKAKPAPTPPARKDKATKEKELKEREAKDKATKEAKEAKEKERKAAISQAAEQIFDQTAESKEIVKISDGLAKKILASVAGHEESTALMQSFLEGNDYKRAKDLYLGKRMFSERDKPAEILDGLRSARDFFKVQGQVYGKDGHEGSKRFETKTLERLRTLDPDKYKVVRRDIDREDAKVYDKAKSAHERATKAYQRKLEAWQQKPFQVEKPEPPPAPPVEPLGYRSAKDDDDLKEEGRQLWDDLHDRSETKKTAGRVAAKFLVSSYVTGMAMGPKLDSRSKRTLQQRIARDFIRQTRCAVDRDELESAVYARFPPSSRRKAGGNLTVMLTGVGASRLKREDYSMVTLSELSVPELTTLAKAVNAKMARRSSDVPTQDATRKNHILRETDHGVRQMLRLSKEQKTSANEILASFDQLTQSIQDNHQKWGMSFDAAKQLVNHLDRTADATEVLIYGPDSLRSRQAEIAVQSDAFVKDVVSEGLITRRDIAKAAEVLQRDSDEPYMDTFDNSMEPLETDSDEPYMSAFDDDQSSAVYNGKDENGRALAP